MAYGVKKMKMKIKIKMLFAVALLTLSEFANAADFVITDYGARPDGSKCSAAFKAAFAAASKAGGGRIVVPKGSWVSGAIHLKSNCEFHLAEGAEIVFTQDPADYLPAVHTSWEGVECWNYSLLVYTYYYTNIAITGKGMSALLWTSFISVNGYLEGERFLSFVVQRSIIFCDSDGLQKEAHNKWWCLHHCAC